MKIRNYHFESSSKEPVTITWSRHHASLLAAFGYYIKKDGDYFDVYKEIIYYNQKKKENAYRVHKKDIVSFLQRKGAKLRLGNTDKKTRNLSFSNFNN
jgi:hypothetical protein